MDERQVRRLIAQGTLPAVKIGPGLWRIRTVDAQMFVDERSRYGRLQGPNQPGERQTT